MTTDDQIKVEKYNIILIGKLQKYQLYHQRKKNEFQYLADKKILPSNQKQIIEETKFTYSPLEKRLKNKQKNKLKH